MPENILEKIIQKKIEKIADLKNTISLESLNELINTNKTFINFKEKIENNIKELYLASSSEVYQTPKIIPTGEDVPLIVPDVHNPRFSYGGGKIISELLAINFCRHL